MNEETRNRVNDIELRIAALPVINKHKADWLISLVRKQDEQLRLAREALQKIANTDYRGNRSTESNVAYYALKKMEES